jgi:hypothetical protein
MPMGLCERICSAIKAADDQAVDEAGYMLDSNDCIAIVRQEFARATTPRPASEPYAYDVYFPGEQRAELVRDLDEILEDLTNLEHRVTPLYDHTQPAAKPRPQPLTEEYIKRHSILAADCPGASAVILASTVRRLVGITAQEPTE